MASIIFKKLFNISLKHEFYEDETCNDVMLEPTQDTISKLRNYGLIFKNLANGGIVLFEAEKSNGTTVPKIPIDSSLKFTFQFNLINRSFQNFTDIVSGSNPRSIYYFNNLSASVSGQVQTILNSQVADPISLYDKSLMVEKETTSIHYILLTDIESKIFKYYFKPGSNNLVVDLSEIPKGKYDVAQFDINDSQTGSITEIYCDPEVAGNLPFGVFEVFIDETYDVEDPATFLFNFKSRQTQWRYKVLKNIASPPLGTDDFNATTLSVVHEPDNPADKIIFNAATGTDPIIIGSQSIIKLKEKSVDKIRLKKNGDNLISNLPNASADKLEHNGTNWITDIYVYVYV